MSDARDLCLIGFSDSVYAWAARLCLAEKGLRAAWEELNPFDRAGAAALRGRQPFGRVPVLRHGDFTLYETVAILVYLDRVGGGQSLTPEDPKTLARMHQVMSLINAQAYWPLVRQVFSHGYYQTRLGLPGDDGEVTAGLAAAGPVLDALEEIASEARVLCPGAPSLACVLLAPMLGYFGAVPDAAAMIAARPCLAGWVASMQARPAYVETRPACLNPKEDAG